MTDEIQTALIGGLLGGGVAGSIFGWLASLSTQGRQFRETNRHRFTDLRRERYAAFLREADEHVRVLLLQRSVAHDNAADDGSRPLPTLGSTDELSHMASEIGLLELA